MLATMDFADTSDLAGTFRQQGCLPATRLLDEDDCQYLRDLAIDDARYAGANRRKGLWQVDERTMAVATSAPVTERLDALFGEHGYYLWGAQLIDTQPGEVHFWHTDIETAQEGFISIWIGIAGTNERTSLHVIERSHQLPGPVQAYWPSGSEARVDPLARRLLAHPDCPAGLSPKVAVCGDGEGFFFDGRVWHGSFNSGAAPRRALLIQYGRHGVPIRTPKSFSDYPFSFDEDNPPLTTPVRGAATPTVNKSVARRPDGGFTLPHAKIFARPELVRQAGRGWTVHPYFATETPVMAKFTCHASVLEPGFMPHTAHEHREEEIFVILSGRAEVFVQADPGGALRSRLAVPGDIFYCPSGFSHTIVSRSETGEPLRYVMFRWVSRNGARRPVPAFHIPASTHLGGERLLVERPSSGLEKIHIHSSTLAPGQGFPRHIDLHDAAILVLSGDLTVLDQTLGPGGTFLTRAGELHDTRNLSTGPNHYLVFTFHAAAG